MTFGDKTLPLGLATADNRLLPLPFAFASLPLPNFKLGRVLSPAELCELALPLVPASSHLSRPDDMGENILRHSPLPVAEWLREGEAGVDKGHGNEERERSKLKDKKREQPTQRRVKLAHKKAKDHHHIRLCARPATQLASPPLLFTVDRLPCS